MRLKTILFSASIIIGGIVYPLNQNAASFGSTVSGLHTSALVNGKQAWIPCPNWDWTIVEAKCLKDGYILNQYMISPNCLPRCGNTLVIDLILVLMNISVVLPLKNPGEIGMEYH